jgi:transcriptional antiterminator RfaH
MTQWLLLHSKAFKEEFLWREINARQIECYLPRLHVTPVNPRSRKIVPYFPGYLFVQLEPDHQAVNSLRWLPGATGWVHFGEQIASVPEAIVSGIRRHVDALNAEQARGAERFTRGERLEILGGPFEGFEAIFDTRLSGRDRVRVLIQLVHAQQLPAVISARLLKSTKKQH